MSDKRQRQVQALKAHGATEGDIQIVLGSGADAIKPNNQTIRRRLRQLGMDVVAVPFKQAEHLCLLAKVARIEFYKG